MDLLRAFLLGLIQAVTEFLPISSSAHLLLFRNWLGFDAVDGLTFDVALHMGTVAALIGYFRADLARMVRSVARPSDVAGRGDRRLALYLVLATIPAAAAGAGLGDFFETAVRRPPVVVVTLVLGGVLFLVVERMPRARRALADITLGDGLVVGFAQSLALIPGVSRSGITITAGMARGIEREAAARFSFLLSIPIMLGAGFKSALDVSGAAMTAGQALVLAVGAVTSAAGGWLVIRFLLKFFHKHRLDVFAYYRVALAMAVLLSLAA